MPPVARRAAPVSIIGIVVVSLVASARGEIVTIDATVKAIDAKERTITVVKVSKTKSKEIELEIGKKAKILQEGKDVSLDALKPGQTVSVSYESELEVVTKIELGGIAEPDEGDLRSNIRGCRVVWSISEAGDCVLTIGRPPESRLRPKGPMMRHDDGTVEFHYDLDEEEDVDRAMMGGAEGTGFDKSRRALVLTPKKGDGARFNYSKLAHLPVTLDFEFDTTQVTGGFTLIASVIRRDRNVEFPVLNLASKDNFTKSAVVSCGWVSSRDAKGAAQFENRLAQTTFEMKESKEFRFTIPRLKGQQPCLISFGVRGDAPASLRSLVVRGRLVPTLGIALADKGGEVVAEKVLPKGLAETVGIKSGDVIQLVHGDKVGSVKEALELLGRIRLGDETEIVVRRGGRTLRFGFTAE